MLQSRQRWENRRCCRQGAASGYLFATSATPVWKRSLSVGRTQKLTDAIISKAVDSRGDILGEQSPRRVGCGALAEAVAVSLPADGHADVDAREEQRPNLADGHERLIPPGRVAGEVRGAGESCDGMRDVGGVRALGRSVSVLSAPESASSGIPSCEDAHSWIKACPGCDLRVQIDDETAERIPVCRVEERGKAQEYGDAR